MSEQRATWLRRLVGSASLEEQLSDAKTQAHDLASELEQTRAQIAELEQELSQVRARTQSVERDSEARLISLRQSTEEQQVAHAELEQQHKNTTSELAITRSQLTRQRDESSKLNKSLAAANAQLARVETAALEARAHATASESKLAVAEAETTTARRHIAELERSVEASAKELEDTKRRLQSVETRASTVEHELAQTKQTQQRSDEEVQRLSGDVQRSTAEAQRLSNDLQRAVSERELAQRVTNDAWRALERTVGDAAPLALALGVDTGFVERQANLAAAILALKHTLEKTAQSQAIKLEAVEDGMVGELGTTQPLVGGAVAHWLVAFSAAYLEKASGLQLAMDGTTLTDSKLAWRLRTSAASG